MSVYRLSSENELAVKGLRVGAREARREMLDRPGRDHDALRLLAYSLRTQGEEREEETSERQEVHERFAQQSHRLPPPGQDFFAGVYQIGEV